ncbi:MAG: hypothetical protein AABN34_25060 [Acidobacteriota bacterium]
MLRRYANRRFTLMNRAAVVVSVAALFIVFSSGVTQGQSSKRAIGEGRAEIVEKVSQYPDSSISFENYEEVPLLIQEAKVKEIGNAEYYQLTGFTTDSPAYISFPNVTLINNTDQRVIGLTLAVGNKQTKQIHGVKLSKITIEPRGSYSVKASDFVRPERTVEVTKSGKVTNRLKPGLDSEKLWFRGSASDMVLVVGMVDFENGTRWMMDPSKDPW